MDKDARIALLEEENGVLRERIAQLESALICAGLPDVPIEWGLTAQEAIVVGVLFSREIASKETIMTALYGGRVESDLVEPKIVDVFVCKARKKLAPFNVEIVTHWGRGWSIPAEQRAFWKEKRNAAA